MRLQGKYSAAVGSKRLHHGVSVTHVHQRAGSTVQKTPYTGTTQGHRNGRICCLCLCVAVRNVLSSLPTQIQCRARHQCGEPRVVQRAQFNTKLKLNSHTMDTNQGHKGRHIHCHCVCVSEIVRCTLQPPSPNTMQGKAPVCKLCVEQSCSPLNPGPQTRQLCGSGEVVAAVRHHHIMPLNHPDSR